MRGLLDTHAFLWWYLEAHRLSDTARTFIEEPGNEVVFSAVSGWEIAIKFATGQLKLPEEPVTYVPRRLREDNLQPLSIELTHALRAGSLPPLHRDPFDRLLVAQSQLEDLPILTSDARIAAYGVEVIW